MIMKKLLWIVVLAVLLAGIGVPGAAAQEDECFQKGGTWDAATQKCVARMQVDIQITYPLEMVAYDFAEQAIDEFLQAERAQFFAPLTDVMLYWSPGPLSVYISYETFQFSPDIISLNFTISTYTGGAHPNSYFRTFTFDLAGQRVLALPDLFLPGVDVLSVIAPIAQQSLIAQLGDMSDAATIALGAGPDPLNYQNFVLTPDALVFYFPPYQVAAYAAGPQMVSLPLADLRAILAPPFNGQ
jgi:hypothetical protein